MTGRSVPGGVGERGTAVDRAKPLAAAFLLSDQWGGVLDDVKPLSLDEMHSTAVDCAEIVARMEQVGWRCDRYDHHNDPMRPDPLRSCCFPVYRVVGMTADIDRSDSASGQVAR